jgi:hypothetical protein
LTTTLLAPPGIETVVADLVLVRMALPQPMPKRVRADVGKLVGAELSAAEFDDLRDQLAAAGLLTRGKRKTFGLTDAGRERAFRFVGVAELAPRMTWSRIIAQHLFPKAAGLPARDAERLKDGDKLSAFILKRKYELGAAAGSTVRQVLEAIVCKKLGFPDETTIQGLLCAVLSRLMDSGRLKKDKLITQLPLFQTGLKAVRADDARRLIVRDWLAGAAATRPSGEPPSPEQFDLPAFAATARALAASSPPQDRFHDNKVFIAAAWQASQRESNFPRLSLPEFKKRLVEANSNNLLHLSRADLVQAMDRQLVADSETVYLNATFHFILLEGGR